mmetsp:Transcript_15086/g.32978  ORF Transcript_15086/g.32978 Transcript_15086/m.32978 type:complete len:393 (-) Transcript_15086:636-1814(-)
MAGFGSSPRRRGFEEASPFKGPSPASHGELLGQLRQCHAGVQLRQRRARRRHVPGPSGRVCRRLHQVRPCGARGTQDRAPRALPPRQQPHQQRHQPQHVLRAEPRPAPGGGRGGGGGAAHGAARGAGRGGPRLEAAVHGARWPGASPQRAGGGAPGQRHDPHPGPGDEGVALRGRAARQRRRGGGRAIARDHDRDARQHGLRPAGGERGADAAAGAGAAVLGPARRGALADGRQPADPDGGAPHHGHPRLPAGRRARRAHGREPVLRAAVGATEIGRLLHAAARRHDGPAAARLLHAAAAGARREAFLRLLPAAPHGVRAALPRLLHAPAGAHAGAGPDAVLHAPAGRAACAGWALLRTAADGGARAQRAVLHAAARHGPRAGRALLHAAAH